jgi:hypothetical protein
VSITDFDFAAQLDSALDRYVHAVVAMVDRWFDGVAYEACSRAAAGVRALLSRVPDLRAHTLLILGSHDCLVLALWRSSNEVSRTVLATVRERQQKLLEAARALRNECHRCLQQHRPAMH